MQQTKLTDPASEQVYSPDIAFLARCIRHLIYRDLEKSSGDKTRVSANTQLLLSPETSGIDPLEVAIGADGVGLDSLAMISAATAVSRFFDLGPTGLDDYLLFEQRIGAWAAIVSKGLKMRGPSAQIVFETSGSTDRPSLVRKPLAALIREVDAVVPSVVPKGTKRIVALVPPQHIFGFLFTVLLPARLDLPVVDAAFSGAGRTVGRLQEGDAIVGTPFNWKTLLDYGAAFATGVVGVTSGGAAPAQLWPATHGAGLTRLTEVFGSTETGGLGWRSAGDEPFTLLPNLARRGEDVTDPSTGKALPLQDHIRWIDDVRFVPVGRVDRAVQVAGVNVSLSKVRDALCDSEQVADAALRLDGDVLKAFVVPSDPDACTDALLAHLNAHMDGRLKPVARPRKFMFGAELPRNSMGKLKDW